MALKLPNDLCSFIGSKLLLFIFIFSLLLFYHNFYGFYSLCQHEIIADGFALIIVISLNKEKNAYENVYC